MGFYPVYLKLDNMLCLVVGGGNVAFRKISTLLEFGGKVRVISESVVPEIEKLVNKKNIEYFKKPFSPEDLAGAFLVIGATDNPKVNKVIYRTAGDKKILVNIVDSPDECNFIVPSIVRQGDLCVSISTGGKSPALAKKIRKQLQKYFGSEYIEFLNIMGELRSKVVEGNPNLTHRMELFKRAVESDALEMIKNGHKEEARKNIEKILLVP